MFRGLLSFTVFFASFALSSLSPIASAGILECPKLLESFEDPHEEFSDLNETLENGIFTERLVLRKLKKSEVERYIESNIQMGAYYHGTRDPETISEHARSFADLAQRGFEQGTQGEIKIILAVFNRTNGDFVGTFHMRFVPNARLINIGVGVDPKAQRNGYATEFVKGGTRALWKFFPQVPMAWSTDPQNRASIEMAQKLGFKFKGNSPIHPNYIYYTLEKF